MAFGPLIYDPVNMILIDTVTDGKHSLTENLNALRKALLTTDVTSRDTTAFSSAFGFRLGPFLTKESKARGVQGTHVNPSACGITNISDPGIRAALRLHTEETMRNYLFENRSDLIKPACISRTKASDLGFGPGVIDHVPVATTRKQGIAATSQIITELAVPTVICIGGDALREHYP